MRNVFVFTALVLNLTSSAFAESLVLEPLPAPQSKEEFCKNAQDLDYFRRVGLNTKNRISFENGGGLASRGVCWWHSRFQRNALYLTIYRPDLPKPTEKQAEQIIGDIMGQNRVVEIPGYNNLKEFTADWQKQIQKTLENWQIKDGTVKFSWIKGMSGSAVESPEKLKELMDELYNEVEVKKKITYQMLQMKGIMAHARLVVSMKPINNGYFISYIDSNFPTEALTFSYQIGSTFETQLVTFENKTYRSYFVPYTDRQGDFKSIGAEILRYCKPKIAMQKWLPKVQQLANTQSGGARDFTMSIIEQAKGNSKFNMLLRDQTLSSKDLEPQNWSELLK